MAFQSCQNSKFDQREVAFFFLYLCSVFDSLLFRPPTPSDIKEYLEVQTVLREEIVNPLRKNMYVRADRIMKLRTMLDHLSSVRGLTTEEKGEHSHCSVSRLFLLCFVLLACYDEDDRSWGASLVLKSAL